MAQRHAVQGALLAMALTIATAAQAQTGSVQLYSAGSLREALTEVARNFEAESGQMVALTFGASGLLRERIEKGEPAQVFASADVDHPQRLAQAGGWGAPRVFARNLMCALAAPSVNATPDTLLDTLLQPAVRVGTSTPKADPSGDYAWALFRRAEAVRPGAFAALDAKALKLTGGADSAQPPAGRSSYAWNLEEGRADIFIVYCTNAAQALREAPRLKVIEVPAAMQVAASYGLTVRQGASPAATQLSDYLLGPAAQAVLRRYGFGAPVAP
jgi:molybdate transport system substrate-binding protein